MVKRARCKPEAALEPAVVAASLAPHESGYKGVRFAGLPFEVSRDIRRTGHSGHYGSLITQLRERLDEQRGYFVRLSSTTPDRSGPALALLARLDHKNSPASLFMPGYMCY